MDFESYKENNEALLCIHEHLEQLKDAADNLGEAAAPKAISTAVEAIDAAFGIIAINHMSEGIGMVIAELAGIKGATNDNRPYDADTAISKALDAYDEGAIAAYQFVGAMREWSLGNWRYFCKGVGA